MMNGAWTAPARAVGFATLARALGSIFESHPNPMKRRFIIAIAAGLAAAQLNAQVDQTISSRTPDEIGGNYRTWAIRGTDEAPNAPSTVRTESHRRITEIATGMNYWDGQAWVPSVATFDITESGFEATRMQ